MPPKLLIDYIESSKITYIKVMGVVDEDNYFANLQFATDVWAIDTGLIERINSCGVRDWIQWLLGQKKKIYLVYCPPAFIMQVNLLKNFASAAIITSFYVPYICPDCSSDQMLLMFTAEALKKQPFEPPKCTCEECGAQMEVDVVDEFYFNFLNHSNFSDADPEELKEIERLSKDKNVKRFPPPAIYL